MAANIAWNVSSNTAIDWLENAIKYLFYRFDIQLMKSGRMKGQAFVTFPDQWIAEQALRSTNGYLINDKPIVVVINRLLNSIYFY